MGKLNIDKDLAYPLSTANSVSLSQATSSDLILLKYLSLKLLQPQSSAKVVHLYNPLTEDILLGDPSLKGICLLSNLNLKIPRAKEIAGCQAPNYSLK